MANMQMAHMNRYLVQITEYHGEFIDAEGYHEIGGQVCFYIIVGKSGNEPITKYIAKYNLEKIYGWREMK